jgi:hypothetical protein
MRQVDLEIPPEQIPAFIQHAELVVGARRVKTSFGVGASIHVFHSGILDNEAEFVVILVLEVRSTITKAGRVTRVFLTDVRPPAGEEIVEGGYVHLREWPEHLHRDLPEMVLHSLRDAAREIQRPAPLRTYGRGYLAFFGARLTGEYYGGGWRLSAPTYPSEPPLSLVSEQYFACEREIAGRDVFDIGMKRMAEQERLAVVLTVFFATHVTVAHTAEQRWVLEDPVDGQFVPRIRQLGFCEPRAALPRSMPPEGTLPPGPTRPFDRLNPNEYGTSAGEFALPDDAMFLLDIFSHALATQPLVAERFLAAAKAYETSHVISRTTSTGALAYLVVASEALVDEKLATCNECGSKRYVSRAMKNLIFGELPCLVDRHDVKRLLNEAYGVRSKHFHEGGLSGGELEPWRGSHILLPMSQELSLSVMRMRAVVNALLVAWLVRRATDEPWPRASQPMPQWNEPQLWQVGFRNWPSR